MENASKALLIAGAILLCILIIAIGMYIYNSAQGTIVSSLNSLSTQEVESFNNQFESYQGVQKGTTVKNMMGKLISNANTYTDEPLKIPHVMMPSYNVTAQQDVRGNSQKYIDTCGKIKSRIKTNQEYDVLMTYQNNGLIDIIHIFDKDEKKKSLWHRLRPVYK